MMILLVVSIAIVVYVVGLVVSYNYWKTSLHLGFVCNRELGRSCDDGCWLGAMLLCTVWPISPFAWFGYRALLAVFHYLTRLGKKLGSAGTNLAKRGTE